MKCRPPEIVHRSPLDTMRSLVGCGPSAIPAPFALVTHFAKLTLQSSSLLTIRWRVGQTIAKIVFSVSGALAVLAIIAPLLPALRADSGYPRNRNLNRGLPRGWGLRIGWHLRECACEQKRGGRGNADLDGCSSSVSITDNGRLRRFAPAKCHAGSTQEPVQRSRRYRIAKSLGVGRCDGELRAIAGCRV